MQATFLTPVNQAVPDNPALQAELEALDPDDLELRCRRSGMSRAGGRWLPQTWAWCSVL